MLTGKNALVTGASRGIGRQIALTLAAAHAFVIVNYNGSKEKADAVVAEIKAAGGWMYSVNGRTPNVGASNYQVSNGDVIVFYYVCEYEY